MYVFTLFQDSCKQVKNTILAVRAMLLTEDGDPPGNSHLEQQEEELLRKLLDSQL
jgi:hypothetical protein